MRVRSRSGSCYVLGSFLELRRRSPTRPPRLHSGFVKRAPRCDDECASKASVACGGSPPSVVANCAMRRLASSSGFEATLQTKPAGATHWRTRTTARAEGVSKDTIQQAWQDHGLKPHLNKNFEFPRGPIFLENLTDMVEGYLTPPQNAVVLCVDEKSRIQAPDRTQPGLPLKLGRLRQTTIRPRHDHIVCRPASRQRSGERPMLSPAPGVLEISPATRCRVSRREGAASDPR
jgi:hypothetical protein